jgi:hypothetical protein
MTAVLESDITIGPCQVLSRALGYAKKPARLRECSARDLFTHDDRLNEKVTGAKVVLL